MNKIVIKIYEIFKRRPWMAWGIFLAVTSCLILSLLRLGYKEDISDFLPLDEKNQMALSIYQDISGADRIYAIISTRDTLNVDPQELVNGVESFVENVESADTSHYLRHIVKEVNMEAIMGVADIVYENIPYFLNDSDYQRIDSLLNTEGYIERQVEEDKQMLLFPSSGILASNISRDPLNLFTPSLGKLKQSGMPVSFETYDGYILSPDSRKAIVIMESSFGSSESENNAKLVELLDTAKSRTEILNGNIDVHLIGGPVIAVANAERIKSDSVLAISIAGVLILALLIYVFRSLSNILLIVISVGWGWLFAMGCISLYYDSVSIIVIGIASVILGIAVNYPLHLIDHLKGSEHPKTSLKEVVAPLVVGNITTVGAFLCLVPLNAPALHDLGLFSSLLLVGTILFVLIFLPQAIRRRTQRGKSQSPGLIGRLAEIRIENNRFVVYSVLALTLFFGYFSFKTEFDSDMRNINYMTQAQLSDMEYFSSLVNEKRGEENLYVVSKGSTWDEALSQEQIMNKRIDSLVSRGLVKRQNEVAYFLKSKEEQKEALERWNKFLDYYKELIIGGLKTESLRNGFSSDAFSPFEKILTDSYDVKEFMEFRSIIDTAFSGNITESRREGRKYVVEVLNVATENIDNVKSQLVDSIGNNGIVFDVKSMNGSIANTLSDDFNYIGIACGCIVFLFLWLSLGRLELAIISFMPMAFSWIWILGIMALLGIKFNIVNVILATFIFGQGDDYTIFMTEGLSYELAYRKKLLVSYKNSIIVSALIMFIGIGTLLVAKHPAMRSLGEVTVIGMLSVVLMAYLFPPLMFRWLTEKDGKLRYQPITIRRIFTDYFRRKFHGENRSANSEFEAVCDIVYGRYLYKGVGIERNAKRNIHRCREIKDKIVLLNGDEPVLVEDNKGQGELALLMTLLYPGRKIYSYLPKAENREILRGCLIDFSSNVIVLESVKNIEKEKKLCVIEY